VATGLPLTRNEGKVTLDSDHLLCRTSLEGLVGRDGYTKEQALSQGLTCSALKGCERGVGAFVVELSRDLGWHAGHWVDHCRRLRAAEVYVCKWDRMAYTIYSVHSVIYMHVFRELHKSHNSLQA